MRREIVHIEGPARTYRVEDAKPWWQECGIEEFKSRVDAFPQHEREALFAEIKGTCALISATVTNTALDKQQRTRARTALGYVTEKRRILQAAVQRGKATELDSGRIATATAAAEARACLDAGNRDRALLVVIEWMELFSRKKP